MAASSGYIYSLTNLMNLKEYIGQAVDAERRWLSHFKAACEGSGLLIHRAIRKYGATQFALSIVRRCPFKELNYWEEYDNYALDTELPIIDTGGAVTGQQNRKQARQTRRGWANPTRHMTVHPQVLAKVNMPVDRGMKELVEALSLFPELQTIESDEGKKDGWAWISFVYGDQEKSEPWKPLSEFVFSKVGPKLVEEFGDRVDLKVGVTESGSYRAEMAIQKETIPAVIKLLRKLNQKKSAA